MTDDQIVASLLEVASRDIGGGCTSLSHGFVEVGCPDCNGNGFHYGHRWISPLEEELTLKAPVRIPCLLCKGKGFAIVDSQA